MSYGKRADAAFFVAPNFNDETARRARRGRRTDPDAPTQCPSDLIYIEGYNYERPVRPSRPVAIELREYLSDERRDDDESYPRDLKETFSDSCTFVRKKVTRASRVVVMHRISIVAAALLGVALLVAFTPSAYYPAPVRRYVANAVSSPAPRVAKYERVPAPAAEPSETPPAAAATSAPSAAPSSSSIAAARGKRPLPASSQRAHTSQRDILLVRGTKDPDKGWTIASAGGSSSPSSSSSAAPSSAASSPVAREAAPTTTNSESMDRARQDLAAANVALANTL